MKKKPLDQQFQDNPDIFFTLAWPYFSDLRQLFALRIGTLQNLELLTNQKEQK